MKIILEGADCTGKTTHLKQLKPDMSRHSTKIPKTISEFISCVADDILFINNKVYDKYVMDRSFIISERIYSEVLNRNSFVTEDMLWEFIKEIADNNVKLIIHCFHNYDTVEKLIKKEDENLPIYILNQHYISLFQRIKNSKYDVDCELIWLENVMEENKNES